MRVRIGELVFFQTFTANEVFATALVLPVRNVLFEQDSDIRVSNLFARVPRVVER